MTPSQLFGPAVAPLLAPMLGPALALALGLALGAPVVTAGEDPVDDDTRPRPAGVLGDWPPQAGYSIPLVDLAHDVQRQVVVDREDGQYLGHPTTVLLEDGRTLITVYPKGHGKGPIQMKRPSSWNSARYSPTPLWNSAPMTTMPPQSPAGASSDQLAPSSSETASRAG